MSTRIVTPPGRATGALRLPLALIALLGVAACSDTQSPQPGFDPTAAFAPPSSEAVTHVNCTATAGTLAGNKSVLVAVNDASGNNPVVGAIVTALSPQYGPICWGVTSSDGNVSLNNLKKDAAILLSIRDELASDGVRLEIVPPDPLTSLNLDDLTPPGATRHAPTLVGGTACTTARVLTWGAYSDLRGTPCVIPGSNFDLTVNLPATTAVKATILDPDGNGIENVIVGAVSPAFTWNPAPTTAELQAECAKVPFRLSSECVGNSHGPAMLQAMDLTNGDGEVELGVAQDTGNPIVFEAIGDLNGQTLFGTIVDGGTTLLSPGMCMVTEVPDNSEPWSVPDVDILSTAHSVGMVAVDNDPLTPGPELDPVPTTLVVKIRVKANGDGGAGSLTMNYRTTGTSGNLTVRSNFAIPAPSAGATCSAEPGTGSGMTGATLVPQCAQAPGSTDEFIVFYSLILPSGTTVIEALYDVSTDGDHTDPERSASYYMRGSIMFEHLTPAECGIQFNNDARWTSA